MIGAGPYLAYWSSVTCSQPSSGTEYSGGGGSHAGATTFGAGGGARGSSTAESSEGSHLYRDEMVWGKAMPTRPC